MVTTNIDIINFISGYVPLKKSGSNFKGLCPFHAEKTPSFIVNPNRNRAHCFGCGWDGDIIDFVKDIKNLSFKEALQYLNLNSGRIKPDPEEIRKKELLKSFRVWCNDYHNDLCQLLRTLYRAKQNVKTIEQAEILTPFYDLEPLWKFDIEILESADDEAKFNLYREVLRHE